jgi:hypothetical protein
MFLSVVLRPSLKIYSSRFLSQTSILPYEIDRFNAARVRAEDWPDNTSTIKERLSGEYSCIVFEKKNCSFYSITSTMEK